MTHFLRQYACLVGSHLVKKVVGGQKQQCIALLDCGKEGYTLTFPLKISPGV